MSSSFVMAKNRRQKVLGSCVAVILLPFAVLLLVLAMVVFFFDGVVSWFKYLAGEAQ